MQVIAEGIIKATKELQLTIPLIVRLQGTKEAEAKKMINESGLKIYPFGACFLSWFGKDVGYLCVVVRSL
jgi:succinyl-CoA synthetase beta subunit